MRADEAFPHLFKPQTVLPDLTRRGRIHFAVETVGLLPHSQFVEPAMYVRTRCGIPDLGPCSPHRRFGFPDCKRCFPPSDTERKETP